MEFRPTMNVDDVYVMCNDKMYFTAGDNDQYGRMFDMVKKHEDWRRIALVIWICSVGYELREIEDEIVRRFDVA